MQEITGRTVIFAQDSFFSMEEVDEEGGKQKNEKEKQIEMLCLF